MARLNLTGLGPWVALARDGEEKQARDAGDGPQGPGDDGVDGHFPGQRMGVLRYEFLRQGETGGVEPLPPLASGDQTVARRLAGHVDLPAESGDGDTQQENSDGGPHGEISLP